MHVRALPPLHVRNSLRCLILQQRAPAPPSSYELHMSFRSNAGFGLADPNIEPDKYDDVDQAHNALEMVRRRSSRRFPIFRRHLVAQASHGSRYL